MANSGNDRFCGDGRRVGVALIGCGSISEVAHLPTILRSQQGKLCALVDADRGRAEALRGRFGLACAVGASVDELPKDVTAAVVAVPNVAHATVTSALLDRGIHVLCEKPLALTWSEALGLCSLAEERRVVLAVGFAQRFHPTTHLLTAAMENGLIGDVLGYDAEFGARFAWPTVSGFYFDRAQAGGGVLMSEGIHTLDRLIHWFGDVTDVIAADNNHGRIETEAILHLRHQRGVSGRARFSWLYDLRNTLEVRGSDGRAVVSRDDPWSVSLYRTLGGREWRFDMRDGGEPARAGLEHFEAQLADFLDASTTGRKPRVDGREGAKVMWLVEEAYRQATRLVHSWGAS